VSLTEALRKSRNEIHAAREEERRRLRRDLHDGLGPELAGITLGVGAARNLAGGDPEKSLELLSHLQDQAEAATRSVRGLVDGLRPAALDDLGLVAAIRHKAESMFSGSSIDLQIEAPSERLALPAAVEVAALRIVLEAVTNVIRHSGATRCLLTISARDALAIEVVDDGQGVGGSHLGVGLDSMRERAEEVGGTLTIQDGDGGGTRVSATLPRS
jgi:signal transduction histidine kinase